MSEGLERLERVTGLLHLMFDLRNVGPKPCAQFGLFLQHDLMLVEYFSERAFYWHLSH